MTARREPSEPVPWRSAEDAAAYVGLGIGLFRAAVAAGEIASIEDRGQQRFLERDLLAYLERKRKPAAWETTPAPAKTRIGRIERFALPTTGVNAVTGKPWAEEAAR